MPLLSKITTFSFDKDTACSAGSFVFVKNLLLCINFLSMLAGIIMIAGGGYIVSNNTNDIVGLSSGIAAASIAIGLIVSVVSFLGCFGAANEKGMLLKTYFFFLIILIILEVSVGIAAYAQRDNIDPVLEAAWIEEASNPNNSQLIRIENLFQCCGYKDSNHYAVPSNCAALYPFYVSGCRKEMTSFFASSLSTIGGAGLVIGMIEIIGLIFSIIMFKKIAQKENAQSSLLNEAWRVNRTKVQYGYQNYQYV
ncbi:Tetraspanin family-domain-containing protein [Globomyces pollinis-pini]|nr:Tetraspanin family-domain-containing protein [Globomyces pollinis-pini]